MADPSRQPARKCARCYFTSHPVHVGRHVAGVLCGPESEISVLVVTVALVVLGRHRHEGFSSSRYVNRTAGTGHLSTEFTLLLRCHSIMFVCPNKPWKNRFLALAPRFLLEHRPVPTVYVYVRATLETIFRG